MTGIVVSLLERNPDRTAFVLRLLDIDGTGVIGRVRVNVREELTSLGYGDHIRVSGAFFEPRGSHNLGGFDYPAYLARSGVYSVAYVKNAEKIHILSLGTGIFRAIQDWRERIRQAYLASTNGQGSAIIQAMVLGEEGGLTDDVRGQFMAAGVTHIISISGSHLGMVAVLCFGLIRGILFLMPERLYHRFTLFADPKKIAAWFTLPLVIFYTLLAGGQVATVRSLVMMTAGLFALILGREHALMQSLAVAALLILGTQPQAIFDISFQLSFLSVFVIGAVVHLWTELKIEAKTPLKKAGNTLVLLIIISLSTSLATAGISACMRPPQGTAPWEQEFEHRRLCSTESAKDRSCDRGQGQPLSSSRGYCPHTV
jgi:competence protein ComEC